MLLKLKGRSGHLELYEDKVVIKRTSLFSKLAHGFTKGDKTIYINQITGIEFRLGGSLVNGYIQFTIPGGNEKESGISEAVTDENSIVFTKRHNDTALKVKNKVEELMRNNKGNTNQSSNIIEEIRQFQKLLEDGIITEEEFNLKKKELLS